MNKNAWAAWSAKNIVIVICFTVLAIVFKKWWIILFCIFPMSLSETKKAGENKEDTDHDG